MKKITDKAVFAFLSITLLFLTIPLTIYFSGQQQQQTQRAAAKNFVTISGNAFTLNDKPFYFAGANAYDLFSYGDSNAATNDTTIESTYIDKARIDAQMARMKKDGVKVVRLWAFSHDTLGGFEPTKGQYNEAQFRRFDYILKSANVHGLLLLPSLENFWDAYGGIDKRLAWEGLTGGTPANRTQFFDKTKCSGCFTSYKNYVAHVLNRVNHYTGVAYKNDPTIFAWELMNEPRYQDATPNENTTGTIFRAWVEEMGGYIKSIDTNHLLTVGIEGHGTKYGFGGDEGNPFILTHQSSNIDFATAHLYPTESWANLSMEQTTNLIKAWVADAHNQIHKPFVISEWNVERTNNRIGWWQTIIAAIEKNDVAGSMFWNYVDKDTGGAFDIVENNPELILFKNHAQIMEAKNGTITPTNTPTISPTTAYVTPTFGPIGDCNTNNTCPTEAPAPSSIASPIPTTALPSITESAPTVTFPAASIAPTTEVTTVPTTNAPTPQPSGGNQGHKGLIALLLGFLMMLLELLNRLFGRG